MISYIGKIEFKKTYIHYILLFVFFLFWNYFSLNFLFFYYNFKNLINLYQKNLTVTLVAFPSGNPEDSPYTIYKQLKQLSYVKKVTLLKPEKVFENLKKEIPLKLIKNFSKKRISRVFPYVIKIEVSSPESFKLLQEQLSLLAGIHKNLKLCEKKLPQILNFSSFLNKAFFILMISWFVFYFLFIYLINNSLNENLKEQNRIFLLLGGSPLKLKLLRIFFFFITLSAAAIISTLSFLYFSSNLTLLLPYFKKFPNFSIPVHLYSFFTYLIFTTLLFPFLIINYTFEKY